MKKPEILIKAEAIFGPVTDEDFVERGISPLSWVAAYLAGKNNREEATAYSQTFNKHADEIYDWTITISTGRPRVK